MDITGAFSRLDALRASDAMRASGLCAGLGCTSFGTRNWDWNWIWDWASQRRLMTWHGTARHDTFCRFCTSQDTGFALRTHGAPSRDT